MGWNVIIAQQVWELWNDGELDDCHSVIELAPQGLYSGTRSTDLYSRFATERFGDNNKVRAFKTTAYDANGNLTGSAHKEFYKLFGVDRYASIDLIDEAADYRLNLNEPVDIGRKFDIVADFGTSEHIFNIGQAFKNAYNLLRPGGLALYQLPVMGQIHHGFFNIHPIVYRSLAAAGLYEIVKMSYFHSLPSDLLKLKVEKEFRFPIAHDIRQNDAPFMTSRFYLKDIWQVLRRDIRTAALVFVALRKIDDKPFFFPQQDNKYGISN